MALPQPSVITGLRQSSMGGRVRMMAALPRLARRDDRASRALARALRTTALGSGAPDERVWIDRIEDRRRRLATEVTTTYPHSDVLWAPLVSLPPIWGRFLMRLVRELRPRSCLELGTGYGISGAYQAASLELNGAGNLTTLEFAPESSLAAGRGLAALGLRRRVELQLGPIGDTLEEVLERTTPVDFAFVDAEHEEAPTLAYFDTMLPHLSEGAIVVFDDIKINDGMRRAWEGIGRHERVSTSLGLGRLGVAVLRLGTPGRAGCL